MDCTEDPNTCICEDCVVFNKVYDLSDTMDELAKDLSCWLDDNPGPHPLIESCVNSIQAQVDAIKKIISSES